MTSYSGYQDFTENSGIEFDHFKPLGTIKVAFFQFLISCSLEVLVVVLLFTRESAQNTCGQIIILLFSQVALWIISLIFDDYYRSRHYFLRLGGYFAQHKKLNKLSAIFLHTVSFGNVVIIGALGTLFQLNAGNICVCNGFLSPTFIILYIFSFEIVIIIPNLINYMLSVNSFNRVRSLSDIEKYECWYPVDNQTRSEIGYRINCESFTAFLEKQADLIQYYKLANNDLSKRLEEVRASLLRYNSNLSYMSTCEVRMST